ncbi:hypothetical protein AN641_04125 [Candidatus Epulonipiscioides gigas]|nr:hypothetical protein AN641_04125 [Epulopiscium sp. SCG-C07WGA-EpuloA2]
MGVSVEPSNCFSSTDEELKVFGNAFYKMLQEKGVLTMSILESIYKMDMIEAGRQEAELKCQEVVENNKELQETVLRYKLEATRKEEVQKKEEVAMLAKIENIKETILKYELEEAQEEATRKEEEKEKELEEIKRQLAQTKQKS